MVRIRPSCDTRSDNSLRACQASKGGNSWEKSRAPCVKTERSPTISQISLREVADGNT
jgi:hypothetical protein